MTAMKNNPPTNEYSEDRHDRRAFTVTELLIVLAVVLVLGLLATRALADTRIRSTRERCISNLHQMWQALRLYADENNDSVPQTAVNISNRPGSAIWDVPRNTANLTVAYGAVEDNFYCPSIDFMSRSNLWDFNGPTGPYRTIGYQWLMERNNPGSSDFDATRPMRRNDGLPYVSKLSKPVATTNTLAQSELLTDWVISQGAGTRDDIFEGVYTANPQINTRGFCTPHMLGRLPEGGNILFQDGHVAFRPFLEMKRRVVWSANRNWWW